MQILRLIAVGTLLLTSCQPEEENVMLPPPTPKPEIAQRAVEVPVEVQATEFISALNRARIQIDLLNRNEALALLQQAEQLAKETPDIFSYFARQVHADLTYKRHGIINHLYIPLQEGKERFALTETLFTYLHRQRIPVENIVLTRISPAPTLPATLEHIHLTRKALHTPNAANSNSTFIAASRELGKLYTTIMVDTAEDGTGQRVEDYAEIASILHALKHYDLARTLLENADASLNVMRSAPENHTNTESIATLETTIEHARQALDKEDPGLGSKLSSTVENWMEDISK